MSHPDPCFDPDNSYEDDDMNYHDDDVNYDDHNDFWGLPENELDDIRDQMDDDEGYDDDDYDDHYDDSMDGDHDSAMGSVGWAEDEYYNPSMDDYGDW
jgi:hypothetical protein